MSHQSTIDRKQPNEFIVRLSRYMPSEKLLDVGAGHGRHAIYFAEIGFEVTAVEPDPAFCNEISTKAYNKHLAVDILQSDIVSLPIERSYDAVVCAMVLHFLKSQEMLEAVVKLKKLTVEGGINVISAYTNQNVTGFMKDNPHGSEAYLLRPGELKNMYGDWEILEYSEDWTGPGVINKGDKPTSYHKVNMIASKRYTPSSIQESA